MMSNKRTQQGPTAHHDEVDDLLVKVRKGLERLEKTGGYFEPVDETPRPGRRSKIVRNKYSAFDRVFDDLIPKGPVFR